MCLPFLAAAPAAGAAASGAAAGAGGLFNIFSILSAGLTAAGTGLQAAQASAASEAQAESLERQAQDARRRGAFEANRLAEEGERIGGRQRASFLSSGVSIEGSPLDVIGDTAAEISLDQQVLKRNAQMRADEFRFDAGMARSNAASQRLGGTIGSIAPFIDAGSDIARFNRNRTRLVNQGI